MGQGHHPPRQMISPADLDLVTVVDDPQAALDIIIDYMRRVGPPDIRPRALG